MGEETLATLKDRTTLGIMAGAGGVLVRDLYSLFARAIGFAKFYVWNISADLFVREKEIVTAAGIVLGLLADLAMGGLIGVTFIHFLRWTRGRNPILKGIGFGIAAWLLLYGIIFHNLPQTITRAPEDAFSNLSAFVGHSLFGLSLGFCAGRLLDYTGLDRSPDPHV